MSITGTLIIGIAIVGAIAVGEGVLLYVFGKRYDLWKKKKKDGLAALKKAKEDGEDRMFELISEEFEQYGIKLVRTGKEGKPEVEKPGKDEPSKK